MLLAALLKHDASLSDLSRSAAEFIRLRSLESQSESEEVRQQQKTPGDDLLCDFLDMFVTHLCVSSMVSISFRLPPPQLNFKCAYVLLYCFIFISESF